MTTANKITLTRIAMIPFFIYFAAQPMLIIDRGNYIVSFPTCTVIALVLFCVVKTMNRFKRKKEEEPKEEEPAPTPEDILLLQEIRDLLKEQQSQAKQKQ